jgi:very-short-patch-repair endonuclease
LSLLETGFLSLSLLLSQGFSVTLHAGSCQAVFQATEGFFPDPFHPLSSRSGEPSKFETSQAKKSHRRGPSLEQIIDKLDELGERRRELRSQELRPQAEKVLAALGKNPKPALVAKLFRSLDRLNEKDKRWVPAELAERMKVLFLRHIDHFKPEDLFFSLAFFQSYDGFAGSGFEVWQGRVLRTLADFSDVNFFRMLWALQGADRFPSKEFIDGLTRRVGEVMHDLYQPRIRHDISPPNSALVLRGLLGLARLAPGVVRDMDLSEPLRSLGPDDHDGLLYGYLLAQYLRYVLKTDPPVLPRPYRHVKNDTTAVQQALRERLSGELVPKTRTRVSMEWYLDEVGFHADIFIHDFSLVIELDGPHHFVFRGDGMVRERFLDQIRDEIFLEAGYRIVRLTNGEIEQDPAAVLEKIRQIMEMSPHDAYPPHSALGRYMRTRSLFYVDHD